MTSAVHAQALPPARGGPSAQSDPRSAPVVGPSPVSATPMPVPAEPVIAQSVPTGPTLANAEQCEPDTKKKKPMNDWAFGVQIGIGRVGGGDVTNPTFTPALLELSAQLTPAQMAAAGLTGTGCSPLDERCRTKGRSGVQLSFPIQLGGAGVGFRVEPTFNFAASAKSYGLYVGPTFNYRVADPLYLGFGLGLKGAWVDHDDWKYGGDVMGRIPLTATYYVVDNVAMVLEFAYGGGVSVFANESRQLSNPLTGAPLMSKTPDATFGLARTWDLTVGVRFP